MLNMNSPTVQNLVQSGFNPYMNNGYTPQPVQQQPMYYGYNTYNPYLAQPQNMGYQQNVELEYYYDPMPKVITNEARGINTQIQQQPMYNNSNNYYGYNSQAFNGYMNPILMRNQMESERIRQREEAIQQGKIWRRLLEKETDDNFDIDEAVKIIESMYYFEPYQEELSIKEKMIIDKNRRIAEIDTRADYYRQNNIPMQTNLDVMRANFYGYYNHLNEISGVTEDCGMMEYFTEVYPLLKQEELSYQANKFSKNLKNNYNNSDFNKLIDEHSKDKSDSYYAKLMETYADTGVKLETSNGLVITADEMEVKLPERLIKNSQDRYYEQRRKFYDAIFRKEG